MRSGSEVPGYPRCGAADADGSTGSTRGLPLPPIYAPDRPFILWELGNRSLPRSAGKAYYAFRAALMVRSDERLTKHHNRFHDPNERWARGLRLQSALAGAVEVAAVRGRLRHHGGPGAWMVQDGGNCGTTFPGPARAVEAALTMAASLALQESRAARFLLQVIVSVVNGRHAGFCVVQQSLITIRGTPRRQCEWPPIAASHAVQESARSRQPRGAWRNRWR